MSLTGEVLVQQPEIASSKNQMTNLKNSRNDRGQIALVVLLIVVVLMTVGFSLISQSIVDVRVSTDDEEALRAFSAAEAGIEEALRQEDFSGWLEDSNVVTIGDLEANVKIDEVTDNYQWELEKNGFMSIILEGAAADTQINISWQEEDDAGLELITYGEAGGTVNVLDRQAVVDADASCLSAGFTSVDPSSGVTIGVDPATDDLLRVRALCNGTTLTINVISGSLPAQKYQIDSRAVAGSDEQSQKTQAIEASRTKESLPSIFDFTLFSLGDIR